MGDIFKAIAGGLARFVFSWILPSAVVVGLFALFVAPSLESFPLVELASRSPLSAAVVLSFSVLFLGVTFAYLSLPIVRVLEGYHLPQRVRRRLLRRQLLRWRRLRRAKQLGVDTTALRGLRNERAADYPDDAKDLLPTRLGNAYRALETYGQRRWHLDSQTLWYELVSVAPGRLLQEMGDAMAAVDFFLSSLTYLLVLGLVAAATSAATGDLSPLVVGVVSLVLVPLAYQAAVRNMGDYRSSVQAVVNLGRARLAKELGYDLPISLDDERRMWQQFVWFVAEGYEDKKALSLFRVPAAAPSQQP